MAEISPAESSGSPIPAGRATAPPSSVARFRRPDGVISTVYGGATVLLNLGTGDFVTLDEFGGRVWAAASDDTIPGIVAALRRVYDVPATTIAVDVCAVVERLVKRGWLCRAE